MFHDVLLNKSAAGMTCTDTPDGAQAEKKRDLRGEETARGCPGQEQGFAGF
jgi:hypothetical protein